MHEHCQKVHRVITYLTLGSKSLHCCHTFPEPQHLAMQTHRGLQPQFKMAYRELDRINFMIPALILSELMPLSPSQGVLSLKDPTTSAPLSTNPLETKASIHAALEDKSHFNQSTELMD